MSSLSRINWLPNEVGSQRRGTIQARRGESDCSGGKFILRRPDDDRCGRWPFLAGKGAVLQREREANVQALLEWIVIKIGPERLLSEFSNRLVADLVALRRGDGVAPATVNRTVTEPLRRIMHRARDAWDQIVPKIDWGKHLLAEPQERVRELTVDEEHRLREAIRDGLSS